MYSVSQTFLNKIKESSRVLNARVMINDTLLTTEEIQEMSVDYSIGEIPGIGNVVSTKLNLKLLRVGNTPSYYTTQTIKPSVSIDDGVGNWMWVPLGTFYPQPDSIKRTDNVIEIECFDILSTLDNIIYDSTLTYPTSIRNVANEIKTKYNLPFKDINQLPAVNMKVKPDKQSVRAVLAELAEMASANAIMDRDGNLTFKKLTTVSFSLDTNNYIDFTLESDNDVKITKLICEKGGQDGDGKEIEDIQVGDTTGAVLRFENDSITTLAELKTIYDRIYPMTYTAYELNCQGMPHLEVGDRITLTDKKNKTYTLPIMTHTLTFNGGMLSTLVAKAPQTDSSTGSTGSNSISNAINKVMADTITVNNILAGNITADNIAANAITADKIDAKAITADKISSSVIDAINLNAGKATIDNALIDVANISSIVAKDIKVGTAQIEDGSITNAKIGNLAVDTAKIKDASITNAKIANLSVDNAKIKDLSAEKITAGDISADRITTGVIDAINANIGSATIDSAKIGNLSADKITTGTLNADRIGANSITTGKLSAGSVTADKIGANAITTDKLNAGAVTADKITAGAITTDKIGANQITANKIATGAITADKIEAGTITSKEISTDTVNAIGISASEITANKIATGEIKVSNANILDGTISGAKITTASITNAQIANATIESAKIKDLSASKINTGTLDATKVAINSTSGRLAIADNTITIKDNQTTPKTRVQVGLDARGKYGILVMNAAGEAIFDSDLGVLSDKGLNDGVVSTDKIKDEAVSPSKIQIQELWADSAYINEFNGQTINADNIVTGTISNDRIDIKGLVKFEALDADLSKLFVPGSGSGTIINGGFIGADTIKAGSIDLYSGLTVKRENGTTSFAIAENGDVLVNGLLRSGNYQTGVSGYQVETNGKAEFNEATIRGSIDLPNAGLTNAGEALNPVRIWAGQSYEKRDLAPFKVLQDGTVIATDGMFSGNIYGKYDNGNIHIHNNEIVIDNTSTTLGYDGQERSIVPFGTTSDNPHIKLSAGQSIINTDLILGSLSDKKIEFSNTTRILSLLNTKLSGVSAKGSYITNYEGTGTDKGYYALHTRGKDGGEHKIKYWDGYGGLIFESAGTNQTTGVEKPYDFKFEKTNASVNVKIQGTLEITESITSQRQNIEMRSVANEGWGFFAT